MFFCHLARVVAVLGMLWSAFLFLSSYNLTRALDKVAAPVDQAFGHGLHAMLVALALGCLAEIGLALRRLDRSAPQDRPSKPE